MGIFMHVSKEQLSYFRILYEDEKNAQILQKIKAYIYTSDMTIIREFCAGNVNLPSPFLLDELEWSLDICDSKIRDIIYDLKVASREFYNSIIGFKYITSSNFGGASILFGQKIIYALMSLKVAVLCAREGIISSFRKLYSKLEILFTGYYSIFRTIYSVCGTFMLFSIWYISVTLNVTDSMTSLAFTIMISATITIGGIFLDRSMNIFGKANDLEVVILSDRYKEFLISLYVRECYN